MLATAIAATFLAGCGGGSGGGGGTTTGNSVPANTSVVLFASSTANDQAASFTTTIKSLTLTNQAGKTVSVLASPITDEFIHLNGHVEPLATVSIPQDTYVSATATYGTTTSACTAQYPGNTIVNSFIAPPNGAVTVSSPISVGATTMGLELNLQVAPLQSGCPAPGLYNTSTGFVSTFNLTPVALTAQQTAPGLQGVVGSVDAGGAGFTVNALVYGGATSGVPAWHATLNSGTLFQNISGASQLSSGQPVSLDLAVQPDGSLVATRVAVLSTQTQNLTTMSATPFVVSNVEPTAGLFTIAQVGTLALSSGGIGDANFSGATFNISGQLTNLGSLPFTPSFTAANLVAGQNTTMTSQATSNPLSPNYTPVSTITLMPQTINGTVTAVASSGSFTTYTVTLASYSFFPQFATQPGQTTLLKSPNTVVVYADGKTQMLNTNTIAAGSLLRFYGLIFNDNGTLRMDCAQVSNGVAQ